MGHKYLDKFWKNGKWHYVYKELNPRNLIDKGKALQRHKQVLKSLPDGVKVVGNKTIKMVTGNINKRFSNDALKQKNKELLAKSNSSKMKNKKLADFLTGLGVKVDAKDYKNRKYSQAADAAQRRGKEMTKKIKAQKAQPGIDAQQKRGKAQTEYYKKKMIPYYLKKESERRERAEKEAKRLAANRQRRKDKANKKMAHEPSNKLGKAQTAYQKKMQAYYLAQESKALMRRQKAEKEAKEKAARIEKNKKASKYKNLNNVVRSRLLAEESKALNDKYKTKKKKKSSGNGWKKNLGMR